MHYTMLVTLKQHDITARTERVEDRKENMPISSQPQLRAPPSTAPRQTTHSGGFTGQPDDVDEGPFHR